LGVRQIEFLDGAESETSLVHIRYNADNFHQAYRFVVTFSDMLTDRIRTTRILGPEAASQALVDNNHRRGTRSVVVRGKLPAPPERNSERMEVAGCNALYNRV